MRTTLLALLCILLFTGASYRTNNFVVTANDSVTAQAVAESSEYWLQRHGEEWLGLSSLQLPSPCVVTIKLHQQDASTGGGATAFIPGRGGPYQSTGTWEGPPEEMLDDVIPHEVLHLVLAHHLGRVPRWASEGICTTAESDKSHARQLNILLTYLQDPRFQAYPFNQIMHFEDYPKDVRIFYAQGWSMIDFLLAQGSKRDVINCLAKTLNAHGSSTAYTDALKATYGFESISDYQTKWLNWIASGRPGRVETNARFLGILRPWRWNRNQYGYVRLSDGKFYPIQRIGTIRGPAYASTSSGSGVRSRGNGFT